MPYVKVAELSEVPPGSVIEVRVGERVFALANAGGEIYAVDGLCPHRTGPLGQGALHGHTLVCPWHAWEFDCRTGECLHFPAPPLARHEVTSEDGHVFLKIPDAGTA